MLLVQASSLHAKVSAKTTTVAATDDFSLYKKSSFTNPSWDSFVEEGFRAFDRQDVPTALDLLKKANNLGCKSPLVLFKLAGSLESIENAYSAVQYYELAAEGFKTAHQEHPYNKSFNENYGRALYKLGRKEQAAPVLQKSLGQNPHAVVYKMLGDYYLDQNDLPQAVSVLEKWLKSPGNELTDEDKISLNLLFARYYAGAGQKDTAKSYYQDVLSKDSSNTEASRFVKSNNPSPRKVMPRFDSNKEDFEKVFDMLNNH